MASQSLDLVHIGHLPDIDFVERVPMRAHEFVDRPGKHQVADLRTHVQTFCLLSGNRVPKSDGAVSGSSA